MRPTAGADPAGMAAAATAERALAGRDLRWKVGQLNQRLLGWRALRRTRDGFAVTDEALAEIERWQGLGAVYAPLRADAWSGRSWTNGGIRPEERSQALAVLQDAVRATDPQGIGALVSEEAPHGHQALGGTVLPVNLSSAASWDVEALEEAAAAVAQELAASGVHLALVSALDVLRDGRWGRSEETFGEDPFLASEMTAAIVRGMQGERRSRVGADGVAVVLKHLAAQGEALGGRNGQSAQIGPCDLEEIHLPPVRAGAAAGALGFMAAYNDIDGIPCCASPTLLTGLLRDDLGFDGIVMADMFAVDRLQGMTGSLPAAGLSGLLAGVDLSLCDEAFTTLAEIASSDPRVEAAIDRSVRRVLVLKARCGLLDGPAWTEETSRVAPTSTSAERIEVAGRRARRASRSLAASSLVLLTNKRDGAPAHRGSTIPLRPSGLGTVIVTGPFADDVPCMLGDYVAPAEDGAAVSIGGALREALPDADVRICPAATPGELPDTAGADAIVVVIGGTSHRAYDDDFADNGAIAGRSGAATGGEGVDLADISLPGEQDDLLSTLGERARDGAPIIGVVVAGRPHVLTRAAHLCSALVWAGYPGPFGGSAIADLLLGRAHAEGRLPMTLPAHPGVLPLRYNDRHDADVYRDVPDAVLFPFGHGLQTRDAEVVDVSCSRVKTAGGESVRVEAVVRVDGDGDMPIRLPVFGRRHGGTRVPRRRELLGVLRARLRPGEQNVCLTLPLADVLADPNDLSSSTELEIDGRRRMVAVRPGPEGIAPS